MPLTSQSCVGPECPWVRGLSPPCWRQPVPGLQVVKGSHASWCHCIPLHYHEAWVAWVTQHVTLSTHRNGLEAASSPRPATSLLILQMPCSCPLPLLGVLTLGLCHSNWPMRLLQPGRQAKRDWHQSSRPASVQSPSHMTVFSSFLTWKSLFGSSQFSQPYFQRQTAQGGEAGDKQVS